MSQVVKYTCRLRRYNYTHNQLNTRYFSIIFKNFFEGGAQNLSLPPGASYPRYATALYAMFNTIHQELDVLSCRRKKYFPCLSCIHVDNRSYPYI